jgi:hypothetical protein
MVELKQSKQTHSFIFPLDLSDLFTTSFATLAAFLALSFILRLATIFEKLFRFFIIPSAFLLRILRTIMVSYIK